MQIPFDSSYDAPLYRKIVDYITRGIESGALPAGFQLPTVRALSAQNNLSLGTVKHAYDILEQMGFIEKSQGRGTFVSRNGAKSSSKKDQAMEAIDSMLDILTDLSFSNEEIRIFFDLKMREREEQNVNVRICAVDCSPEPLSVMCAQLSELPDVDVYEYLLQPVLDSPYRFQPNADIVVTTPTHYDQLSRKMGQDTPMLRLVMDTSRGTLLQLARIPAEHMVGILCHSKRFASIMIEACEKYCALEKKPLVGYFNDETSFSAVINYSDQLILPPNYLRFTSSEQQQRINTAPFYAPPLIFEYGLETGSLIGLGERVNSLLAAKLQ